MKLCKYLALAASLAAPSLAVANTQGELISTTPLLALDDVALNAAAATRTLTATLTNDGRTGERSRAIYSKLTVTVNYTYSAATTVTAQFTCALNGTEYGRRTSTSTSAGATTIYAETGTYTTGAASIILNLEYDVRACKSVQILFGGAGAGAGDLVDVTWVAVAGG